MAIKLVKMSRDGHVVDVHPDMVDDYKAGGYAEGATVEVEEVSTTPDRCLFVKPSGDQCANDAVQGDAYCHLKSHRA